MSIETFAPLNDTTRCDCGHRKETKTQFCGNCWNRIPSHMKANFNSQLNLLRDIVNQIREELKA